MFDKTKNFLLVLALITISIFIGLGTAKAADTIKIDKVIAGNGINFRTTTKGVAVYSMGGQNEGPKKNDELKIQNIYNKGYYLYILNDKKIAGTDIAKARTIRQKALWKVRGYKIVGAYVDEANKLATAAKTAGTNYSVAPSIVSVENPGLLTKNGNYYFSKKIKVKMDGITDNSYKVTFSEAPQGTTFVNKNNSSFQIRIPENSVSNATRFNVTVTGTLSPYKYVKEYFKDNKTDNVALLYETYRSPSKTVVAKVNPNISETTDTNSTDGTYKVTLYIVSGKTSNEVEVESGKKMTKPVTPTREGYNFKGWYTDDTYTVKYDFNKPVTSNLELYAKWELATYTIKYESNGGTKVNSTKVLYDQGIEKPNDPTKSGYYFAGWYKDSEFTSKFSFLTNISKDITLYAKWTKEKPNTHDVTFVPSFGIDPIIVEVKDGQTVQAPLVTNKESDNLAGWFTDESKQTEYDFNAPVKEDLVLYAKWLSADGEEIIETPDTASPAGIAAIIGGIVLFLGGGYVIYTQYGKDVFKKNNNYMN